MMMSLINFKEGDEVFYKEGKEIHKAKFVSLLENAKNDKITFGINIENEKGEKDVILNHFLIQKDEYDAIVEKANNKKTKGRKKMTKIETAESVVETVEKVKTKKAKKEKVATAEVKVEKAEVIKPTLKGINQLLAASDDKRTLVKGDTYHDYVLLDANSEVVAEFKYRKPVKELFAAIETDASTEAILDYVASVAPVKKEVKAKPVAKIRKAKEVAPVVEDDAIDEDDDSEIDEETIDALDSDLDYTDDVQEDDEDL